MTVPENRFWAKVVFKEFIKHYRKLDDQGIVNDVRQSMDDLEDLNDSGTSFGSKMVGWSVIRKDNYPQASENGAKGGRPPTKKIPPPRNKDEVYDFAYTKNIPDWAVLTWWEQNYVERNGCDKDGVVIENWKGALINYFKAEVNKEKGK